MREYEQIMADADDRPAFSNGTMGHLWMGQWCANCRHDSEELVDAGEGCPLIMISLMGKTPAEWTTPTPHGRNLGNYTCTEYEPEEDDDEPPPPDVEPIPGQFDLFDPWA